MSTVQAGTIIALVRNQLIDQGQNNVAYRWSDSELIGWINDAQRAVQNVAPESCATLAVINPLVADVRQPLPANAHMLLDVYRNMGASGSTPGLAPVSFNRDWLNAQDPTWPADTPNPVVRAWMYDPSDRYVFYVYPANDGTGTLEINYSQQIANCQQDTDTLTVQGIYQTPIFDYTMMRALQKDSDYSGGQQVADIYAKNFEAFLAARKGE